MKNLLLILLLVLTTNCFGQSDSLLVDTPKVKVHSPRTATIMSAIVPGLGQIYNRKYWKAPIALGGMAAGIYMISENTRIYNELRWGYLVKEVYYDTEVDPYPGVPSRTVQKEMERFRKYMEISYIATAAIYVLNIVDANVDAHLFDFDVGDDLSLNIRPKIDYIGATNTTFAGLGVSLNFGGYR